MPTRKRTSTGTTRTAETRKKLSRRAMIAALGAGLVGTGLRRTAKAVPMPEPTATPNCKMLGFSPGGKVRSGDCFKVDCTKPYIKVTCSGSDDIVVQCSKDGKFEP